MIVSTPVRAAHIKCAHVLPAGVIFRRDALLSVGGLAASETVGGIDYVTSCRLLGAGFSSMYIDEQLVFDMAPLELAGEGMLLQ